VIPLGKLAALGGPIFLVVAGLSFVVSAGAKRADASKLRAPSSTLERLQRS
jgi:hypothetical protein